MGAYTIEQSWADFKTNILPNGYKTRWAVTRSGYDVLSLDDGIIWIARLCDPADILDFETNYKATISLNKKIGTQVDSDGAVMSRVKVAPAGWNYQMRGIGIKTSTLDSLDNKDSDGVDIGDATLKFYDAQGAQITTQDGMANCVKAILDCEPPYDYYIAGGHLKSVAQVPDDVKVNFIGVPDVPAQMGGSKKFVQNLNAKFLDPHLGIMAGAPQAAKWLQYSATYHTNKMRVVFTHGAGVQVEFEVLMEIYKA